MGLFQRQELSTPTEIVHPYSFSGTDATVFAWFPEGPSLIKRLESMHTLSISVEERKGPARSLGHRGVKGYARGIRTIGGTMIMTVINGHPLRPLQEQFNQIWVDGPWANGQDAGVFNEYVGPGYAGWSLDRHRLGVGALYNNYDYRNRMATLLPPFNIAVQYVSETGPKFEIYKGDLSFLSENAEGAGMMLEGVEIQNVGYVTSVNDIVTEMVFSFTACDYKPLSGYSVSDSVGDPNQLSIQDSSHRHLVQDLFRGNQ